MELFIVQAMLQNNIYCSTTHDSLEKAQASALFMLQFNSCIGENYNINWAPIHTVRDEVIYYKASFQKKGQDNWYETFMGQTVEIKTSKLNALY